MLFLDELYQGRKFYRKRIDSTLYALDKGVLISKYLFSIGMNRHEIEAELYKKLYKVYLKIVNEGELRKKIKYMIDTAEKQGEPPYTVVSFNQSELDLIKSQSTVNMQILLMTMMCVYKYFGSEFTGSQMDIQRLSHLKISSAEFKKMFSEFLNMGYFNNYIKLEKKFEASRYLPYYKPSDELLEYAKQGSFVLQFDDFRNLWVRIHQFVGIEMMTVVCKDCGCIDAAKSKLRERCSECAIEFNRKAEKEWKERNNWIHPNNKGSKYTYYYE